MFLKDRAGCGQAQSRLVVAHVGCARHEGLPSILICVMPSSKLAQRCATGLRVAL